MKRVKRAMTWGEIPGIMDTIAQEAERAAKLQGQIAALHRSLAKDIRALHNQKRGSEAQETKHDGD